MSNTINKFDYQIIKMEKNPKFPFDPIVTITLNNWTTKDDNNVPTISPHLMTEGEIDWYIQAFKDDLDAVGKRAKAALRKAREEVDTYKAGAAQ